MQILINNRPEEIPDDAELPLRAGGHALEFGWDIPAPWAVDARGACYLNDGGHGGALVKVEPDTLLRRLRDDPGELEAREALGRKPRKPDWISEARAHGWTPPPGWDETEFE